MNKIDKNENPRPDEEVCFNCEHMMWMVGLGLGLKCRIDYKSIPNRRHTCEKFQKKSILKDG
jgi:hypothetical protein